MPLARDSVQTRARILRTARHEVIRHCSSGARIERIFTDGRPSDRMHPHHFAPTGTPSPRAPKAS